MTLDDITKAALAALIAAVGWLISYVLKTREQTNARVSRLETKVAETYATNTYVEKVEERLGGALKDINDKLDRLVVKLIEKA